MAPPETVKSWAKTQTSLPSILPNPEMTPFRRPVHGMSGQEIKFGKCIRVQQMAYTFPGPSACRLCDVYQFFLAPRRGGPFLLLFLWRQDPLAPQMKIINSKEKSCLRNHPLCFSNGGFAYGRPRSSLTFSIILNVHAFGKLAQQLGILFEVLRIVGEQRGHLRLIVPGAEDQALVPHPY